jgi:hypothetical protein
MFPQLNGLKLEANDKFIYVFDIDVIPATDKPDHPTVSIFVTNMFIGEEVNPEKDTIRPTHRWERRNPE